MVALNFIKQFADDVESGKKNRTIRKSGKRKPPRVGDALQLFTGMRTRSCRKLADAICTNVRDIKVIPKYGEVHIRQQREINWFVFDSDKSLGQLSSLDGFKSIEDFFAFFEKDLNASGAFEGYLIEWELNK